MENMEKIDFSEDCNVYFLGIGGISMSGLALVLKSKGAAVSGSDYKRSEITGALTESGVTVFIGHDASNIPSDVKLAVYSAAISADNPEIQEIKRRNIPLIPRSKLLGLIMSGFRQSIAVAGTHGKTTTTSMASQILIEAGLDPTISIGGIFPLINSNIRIGKSEYFITEACEYTNSFLELKPRVAIILNVELDHIDYFKNIEEVNSSFKGFASNVSDDGAIIINSAVDGYREIVAGRRAITFGFSEKDDWRASDLSQKGGLTEFSLYYKGESLGRARIPLPGAHNVLNALAACASVHFLGVPRERILKSMEGFTGTKRRFEFKGMKNGFYVYDDYAHHPSEIKATLRAARERMPSGKIWCIFQPHTFTRTKAFLNEFSESFADADFVILADIYAAREKDRGDISSRDLAEKIAEKGGAVKYFERHSELCRFVIDNAENGDMVLTMGAGDIYNVGDGILRSG